MKTNNYAVYTKDSERPLTAVKTIRQACRWIEKTFKTKVETFPKDAFAHAGLVGVVNTPVGECGVFKVSHRNRQPAKHEVAAPAVVEKPIKLIKVDDEGRGRKAYTLSPEDVKRTDWKSTNKKLAKLLHCSQMTIIRLRKSLGKPALPRGRPVPNGN